MGIRIIVDSTADMTAQVEKQVAVVPLTVRFGDKEYVDGVDIDATRFYEMLVSNQELPSTSQPTPFDFEKRFAEAVAAGDSVVCLTISARLSGTYQSASIAAEAFPGRVFVVDSRNVTIGTGVLAARAVQLRQQGLTAEAIARELESCRERVHLIAMVDTLEYLKKGGRISSAVALAGGLLNIKPLLTMRDGELIMADKARGVKNGIQKFLELIGKTGGIDPEKPLLLGYTGNDPALLRQLIAEGAALWPEEEPDWAVVGSVVGTHAGPGAITGAFFAKV